MLKGLRDRAILAVGLHAELRPAEVASLAVEDLHQYRVDYRRANRHLNSRISDLSERRPMNFFIRFFGSRPRLTSPPSAPSESTPPTVSPDQSKMPPLRAKAHRRIRAF